jgi:hypothetical protein
MLVHLAMIATRMRWVIITDRTAGMKACPTATIQIMLSVDTCIIATMATAMITAR